MNFTIDQFHNRQYEKTFYYRINLKLSNVHQSIETFEKIEIRDRHTAQSTISLTPWYNTNCLNSIAQINLGTNPISHLEVVSTLNIINISDMMLYYNIGGNFLNKYNPKLYLGITHSLATAWINDPTITKPASWPEI